MGESFPRAVLRRIVEEVKQEPEARAELVARYLPLLFEYSAPYLMDRRGFSRFKYALLSKWETVFGGEVPCPDFEGIYNYDSLLNRLFSHVVSYRDRLPRVLRLWGIYPAVEVESRVRALITSVLFGALVDLLRFTGDI